MCSGDFDLDGVNGDFDSVVSDGCGNINLVSSDRAGLDGEDFAGFGVLRYPEDVMICVPIFRNGKHIKLLELGDKFISL